MISLCFSTLTVTGSWSLHELSVILVMTAKLETIVKQYLGIDSETSVQYTVTTRDGASLTIDMKSQVKKGGTASDFLRSVRALTVSYQKKG